MNKRIRKILFFIIVFNIILFSFTTKTFAREISEDIDSIDESQYPGIKSMIQDLKLRHPNWKFKVEYTNLSWEEVINAEHQGHSASVSPSNLVQADSPSYGGLWICEICENQRYDTGSWYCASVEALEYMMDPRNSLNDSDLFQFMQLSGFDNFDNETVRNTLKQMASKYPLINDECINATIEAANTYKVDPYYIMAKILEEQSVTSPLYTGEGYNGLYKGYYNLFNIGATATSGNRGDVIINGLSYAASQNWDSKSASIKGGVQIIAKNYISQEQDTLYYQKFDVIGDSKYEHQYQQNVLGAQTAGSNLKKLYSTYDPNLNNNYSFIIPLYKGTPSEKCPRPAIDRQHTQNSGIKMGDIDGDGEITLIDVALMLNHTRGKYSLTGKSLLVAKVSGGNDVTLVDVALVLNVTRGKYVLPDGAYRTATLNQDTIVRLSQNGSEFKKISQGMEIKILKLAESPVADVYWDLVVGSNGVYGYIPRNNYN